MPCYHPIHGFAGPDGRLVSWSRGGTLRPMTVPCGQCVGCRLERSRQWAVRCIHEASLHSANCFVTLTYSPENLPPNGSLVYRDFQLFMKRLRKKCGAGIRFYMCGEYGEKNARPHYHALLFGVDFRLDRRPWRKSATGYIQYRSSVLDACWALGHAEIGEVTFKSAAYVARYIMKKVTGPMAAEYYTDFDIHTGEIFAERVPEFNSMSRRPGIGRGWIEKYFSDVYPSGEVVVNGRLVKPPRYYDRYFNLTDPLGFEQMKFEREESAAVRSEDNTDERLLVKERCAQARLDRLVRPL